MKANESYCEILLETYGTPMLPGTPVDALVAERIGIPLAELTQEKVETYQLEMFQKLLLRVKECSNYYKETLGETDPDKIRTMEDLKRIPYTTERDLAGNEWRFQCVKASDVSRVVTIPTTGTRGKRKRLSYTEADQQKAIAFIHRGYLTMGCHEGERMLIFMSGGAPGSIGDLVKQAMEPIGMEISVFGEVTDVAKAYERLMEFRPEIVEAIPWHAAALARYGQQYGNPEKEFIRSVNLSADVVPDLVADRLKRLWNCTLHRHYGSTEMCIFGGVECIHQDGYHLRPCDILYEIPEPDDRGMGEIVITTLTHEAMPLVRYRTGDIGKMIDTPCGCGAKIRRLEKVWGRESSIIRLGDASFFLSDLADVVYAEDEVVDFDVEMLADGRLSVTVRALPGDMINMNLLAERFQKITGLDSEVQKAEVLWKTEDFHGFPKGYNLKKTVLVNV